MSELMRTADLVFAGAIKGADGNWTVSSAAMARLGNALADEIYRLTQERERLQPPVGIRDDSVTVDYVTPPRSAFTNEAPQ